MRRCVFPLAFLLLAAVLVAVPARADNVLDEKERELERVRQEQEQAGSELDSLRATDEQLIAALEEADRRVTAQTAVVDAASVRVHDAEASVRAAEERIVATQDTIAIKQQEVAARAVHAYKNTNTGGIDAILGARDINEAVDRAELLSKVFTRDREVLDQLRVLREDLEFLRRDLERARGEAERAKADADAELVALEGVRAEATAAKALVEDRIALLDSEFQALVAEQARIEADIEARREELAAIAARAGLDILALEPFESGFVAPTSGILTSPYGQRWGRLHAGVDIANAVGTPIVAVARGIVVSAEWYGGYGNAVLVDHGGGVITLYAHMSAFGVGFGNIVEQGQYLGDMGSTGNSTGPHLHFEVRIGGTPVDPWPYIS